MVDEEQLVGITAKLYRARAAARFLWGEKFDAKMAEWREAIEQVAKGKNLSNLKAAMALSEQAAAQGAEAACITILAAYVQMTTDAAIVETLNGGGTLEFYSGNRPADPNEATAGEPFAVVKLGPDASNG